MSDDYQTVPHRVSSARQPETVNLITIATTASCRSLPLISDAALLDEIVDGLKGVLTDAGTHLDI